MENADYAEKLGDECGPINARSAPIRADARAAGVKGRADRPVDLQEIWRRADGRIGTVLQFEQSRAACRKSIARRLVHSRSEPYSPGTWDSARAAVARPVRRFHQFAERFAVPFANQVAGPLPAEEVVRGIAPGRAFEFEPALEEFKKQRRLIELPASGCVAQQLRNSVIVCRRARNDPGPAPSHSCNRVRSSCLPPPVASSRQKRRGSRADGHR